MSASVAAGVEVVLLVGGVAVAAFAALLRACARVMLTILKALEYSCWKMQGTEMVVLVDDRTSQEFDENAVLVPFPMSHAWVNVKQSLPPESHSLGSF